MLIVSRPRLCALLLIAACTFLAGCETSSSNSAGNPKLPEASAIASLRPGDSLIIILQGVPDPSSNSVQIDDQGLVTLPFIGAISTSGTTTATLSQRIRETYLAKKIYTTVDVSVAVTERYVYVGGEVIRPGRIIWTPDLTVTKAIQSAGGFTLYAKENHLTLVRDRVSHVVNATLAEKKPSEDPRLMPGDAIQVPKSAF
ncbi:MAG: polysaccharide biosynthesis/export family protein [Nibricoccus sp.]